MKYARPQHLTILGQTGYQVVHIVGSSYYKVSRYKHTPSGWRFSHYVTPAWSKTACEEFLTKLKKGYEIYAK